MSRHFRVVRPNLRGFGQSPVDFDTKTGYTAEGFLEDMLAVCDEVSPDRPVHYCGESIGGIIGIMLAASNPQRLRTLSIISTPLTIPQHTQTTFAFGHPTWQDAMRIMGSFTSRRSSTGRRATNECSAFFHARRTHGGYGESRRRARLTACSGKSVPYRPVKYARNASGTGVGSRVALSISTQVASAVATSPLAAWIV